MSEPQRSPVAPAGEEIHLPGPTLHPLLLAVGFTVFLVGITTTLVLVIAGGILFVATLLVWIRNARREFEHLPSEHHH
jgi:Flp pilus assembly protein TadB